jgi:hypothetical protein
MSALSDQNVYAWPYRLLCEITLFVELVSSGSGDRERLTDKWSCNRKQIPINRQPASSHYLTVSQKRLNRRWPPPQHIETALADGQFHDFLRYHHYYFQFIGCSDRNQWILLVGQVLGPGIMHPEALPP